MSSGLLTPPKLDEDALRRLVGFEEGQHFEAKALVDLGPKSAKKEFAVDVTALANGGGGLLVVGGAEGDDTGVVASIDGVEIGDGNTAHRLEQILASCVQPPLPHQIERIPLANGREVIVVAVEGGPLRPHAVGRGSDLAYPVRRGRQKVYLSEAEVADAYGARARAASARDDEFAALVEQITPHLSSESRTLAWILVALVPSGGVTRQIRHDDASIVRDRLQARQYDMVETFGWSTRTDFRAVRAFDDPKHPVRVALFRPSGAGIAAHAFPCSEDPPRAAAHAAYWTVRIGYLLDLLTEHAAKSGASGAADVSLQVLVDDTVKIDVTPGIRPFDDFGLRYERGDFDGIPGSSHLSRHTIDLGVVASDARALVQAIHLLASDFASAYGTVDLGVFDEHGDVDEQAAGSLGWVMPWARRNGLLQDG